MNEAELIVGSDGPERTKQLGRSLATLLDVGDLVVLTGDLGAGKTCFTQGLGSGLGVGDRITSPTFTLASQYVCENVGENGEALILHHLDAYRLDTLGDGLDLDLGGLADTGITVIEWGDLLTPILPDHYLQITIEFPPAGIETESCQLSQDDQRIFRFTPIGHRWVDRLSTLESRIPTTNRSDEVR